MSEAFFDRHRDTLDRAVRAISERSYWSAYPEVPSGKVYGETAKADGQAAYEARLGKPFEIDQPGTSGTVGNEQSPFGPELGVSYPKADVHQLVAGAKAAMEAGWANASPADRVGVCLEILDRLNKRSFEMALAVMHTTGQGWMMAFQAGGPHAQDRGLEAVAYAWQAMAECPADAEWSKRVSKTDTVTLAKSYRVVPKGVAVTIGCSTFPTWNGYPGLFASLATGNAVVVKPHPGAILPLAITVAVARDVLAEAGFDPNVITLAADSADAPIAKDLVTHDDVAIVDYTGGNAFGDWIEANATQAVVFTEKAGVNSAVIDSVEDLKAVTGNLAFTFSLYSGQMCTTTQNVFMPRGGITAGGEAMSFDDAAGAIVKAVNWFLGEPARATEVLGAIANPATVERIAKAKAAVVAAGGEVLRESEAVENEHFPGARVHSPLIVKIDAAQRDVFMQEWFGPIVFLVETTDTDESIALAACGAKACGAITHAVYSTDDEVLDRDVAALTAAGAAVSCNLVGGIFVNQSAAFSDYHVSGGNPAGNASLTNNAFVSPRFFIAQSRRMVAQPAEAKDEKAHAGV